ncbi:MAG: DUF4174 domain-containing protein [Pseudomonadota bacterium]
MKAITYIRLAAAASLLAATSLHAQATTVLERWEEDRTQVFDAEEVTKAELQWLARPLVVFADTPNDPRFQQQMDRLASGLEDLAERDVIIITDTDPSAESEWRTELRPRGYMMSLIGKDGRVALRKPAPWSVRELSRSIDKMPLRQQEIADRRALGQ